MKFSPQSTDMLICFSLESSIIRIVNHPILLDRLVNSVVIFKWTQITYLRWPNTLLRFHPVTLAIVLFWIYFSSDPTIYSAVAFLSLRNSDHVVISVFIDFSLTSCYLKLYDKLQKQICRTVGPSLVFLLSFLAQLDSGILCL